MKHIFRNLHLSVTKINRQHVQLIVLLITLSLFVLGAGAPGSGGGIGGY